MNAASRGGAQLRTSARLVDPEPLAALLLYLPFSTTSREYHTLCHD